MTFIKNRLKKEHFNHHFGYKISSQKFLLIMIFFCFSPNHNQTWILQSDQVFFMIGLKTKTKLIFNRNSIRRIDLKNESQWSHPPSKLPEIFTCLHFSLQAMCYLIPFIELSVSHTSILTILAITVERYYAICLPLRAGVVCTKSKACLTCLIGEYAQPQCTIFIILLT